MGAGSRHLLVLVITKDRTLSVLSLDVMDISGETQRDLSHNILKTRLDSYGVTVPNSFSGELRNDIDKMNEAKQNENLCGSCYGGLEPEGGCCNSCEDVRQAYVNRGWSFSDPDAIEQASDVTLLLHGGSLRLCNGSAKTRAGQRSLGSSPTKGVTSRGASVSTRSSATSISLLADHSRPTIETSTSWFLTSEMMATVTTSPTPFTLSLSKVCSCLFHHPLMLIVGLKGDDEYDYWKAQASKGMKKRLGLGVNPLDGAVGHVSLLRRKSKLWVAMLMAWLDQQGPVYVPVFPQSRIHPIPNTRWSNRRRKKSYYRKLNTDV